MAGPLGRQWSVRTA